MTQLNPEQQQFANEFFDKRMKKEKYKGKSAFKLATMFQNALLKYSVNSYKFGSAYLRQWAQRLIVEYSMYDIGVMLNITRGAALEMLGCKTVIEGLEAFELLEAEKAAFDKFAEDVWKAAEKEAAKRKPSPKMEVSKN